MTLEPDGSEGLCKPQLLGEGPLGSVAQCGEGGQVHVVVGYLTLRLQPEAFRELVGMMALALQQMGPACLAPNVAPGLH